MVRHMLSMQRGVSQIAAMPWPPPPNDFHGARRQDAQV
jgi:hypothetical protein